MDDQALIDSSVFLEMILQQERSEVCSGVLNERRDDLFISDFAFHSVCLMMLRRARIEVFQRFSADLAHRLKILALPVTNFVDLISIMQENKLDYDDSYQVAVARYYNLGLITLDRDFAKLKDRRIQILS